MKILYWTLCALLSAGSGWCMWAGSKESAHGKNFLIIFFGAFLSVLPFLGLLAWTLCWRYYIGMAGLAAPAALILWCVFIMVSPN